MTAWLEMEAGEFDAGLLPKRAQREVEAGQGLLFAGPPVRPPVKLPPELPGQGSLLDEEPSR